MSESSNTPAGDGHPFDVGRFASETIQSIEYGDAMASVLEERVIRIEQVIAARWPRSMVLRWRLAREIRASAATWDENYIPRGDFMKRRYEAVCQMSDQLPEARRHRDGQTTGWARHTGWDSAGEGGTDPGEGFLP